jgi:hypothetical protein
MTGMTGRNVSLLVEKLTNYQKFLILRFIGWMTNRTDFFAGKIDQLSDILRLEGNWLYDGGIHPLPVLILYW